LKLNRFQGLCVFGGEQKTAVLSRFPVAKQWDIGFHEKVPQFVRIGAAKLDFNSQIFNILHNVILKGNE
jgi:hypothetical protein